MERPSDQELLFRPNLSITGTITSDTVAFALGRLEEIRANQSTLVTEINTDGGDADAARRIALEVRLFREHFGQRAYCVGKSNVYSAGVTIFASFAKPNRFLTDDAILLIHERRLETTLQLNGPIRSCLQIAREQLSLLETAQDLELTGFEELIDGSDLTIEQLYEMATTNCYMTARVALKHGLIGGILA
jgi:ATP-dependent protease ClpP protease subunit